LKSALSSPGEPIEPIEPESRAVEISACGRPPPLLWWR
jgi:hypothetical protein